MAKMFLTDGLSKVTVKAIKMLYRNTKVKVRSPDGDTDFSGIVTGVLQEYTFASYLFIICLDNVVRASIDQIKENGFTRKSQRTETVMDEDYTNDIALLANTPTQAESLLHSLEQAAGGIGLHVNTDKMEYMCFNQEGIIFTLKAGPLNLVDVFTYLDSCVSSTENSVNIHLAKAYTAIDRLTITWKSDLSDKIKQDIFQAAVVLILLYGYTSWTLTKRIEKKPDGNCTNMLRAILQKSWKQHTTKQLLYDRLTPPNLPLKKGMFLV